MRTTMFTLAGGAALFAAGAATMYWSLRADGGDAATPRPAAVQAAPGAPARGTAAPALAIELDPEQMRRAGITTEPVAGGAPPDTLRLPGTVQPNAYTRVSVTPFVSGRVTRVAVELGQHVRRGDTIAEIQSPDLADARARYLNAAADVETGMRRLERTERLAALGSASRQELEDVRAEHVRHESEQQQAAARLRLLRVDPATVTSVGGPTTLTIAAPREGVILERPATAGMSADPTTTLATIADLSRVWVIADVHERDIARARLGTDAVVTVESYPGLELHGRITYIAPEVRAETRTTQVRVELSNDKAALRFGMFVTVRLQDGAQAAALSVPARAIQTVGPQTVVYVADPVVAGRFTERAIVIGAGDGVRVEVRSGLSAGERVAAEGAFALRAEVEKLGRPVPPADGGAPAGEPENIAINVTERGFEPETIGLPLGRPARITFTRRTDQTCATEVALPALNIRRALPLNVPVTIELPPMGHTTLTFQCGMGMLKGSVVRQ